MQYIANGRNLSATVLRALAVANEMDTVSAECHIHTCILSSLQEVYYLVALTAFQTAKHPSCSH